MAVAAGLPDASSGGNDQKKKGAKFGETANNIKLKKGGEKTHPCPLENEHNVQTNKWTHRRLRGREKKVWQDLLLG